MPTTKTVGTPSEANEKIGGVPEIIYFDYTSKGRGQVLRLLFEDAGIAYKDTRLTFEEYPKWREANLFDMNPIMSLPVVKLNGKTFTQSYAILRYLARALEAYDGHSSEEQYWVDALCDAGIDFRTKFISAFFIKEQDGGKAYEKYGEQDRPKYLKGFEGHLAKGPRSDDKPGAFIGRNGPFVLGQILTYADLVIYQVCHDDGLTKDGFKGLADYPAVKELCDAVEQRPNVLAFMKSDRYLG